MGRLHDQGVKRNWEHVKETLEDGYWDEVFREKIYYPDYDSPVDDETKEKGRPEGEFDVLAVNYDDQLAMYTEVKSSSGGLSTARGQIGDAQEFFEDKGWDILGKTYVVSKGKKKVAAD